MAVVFFHRLIVSGSYPSVHAFRRRMYREYPRTIATQTWTEVVPFSFESLYDIAPAARRVEREIPPDPLELCAWSVRRINKRGAEVRYQFQTRRMDIIGHVRALSRALPALTFTLVTLCLDDCSIESYRLSRRGIQKWLVPEHRRRFHRDRASKKFDLPADEVYEDDDADRWVEEEMLVEALSHWDHAGRVRRDHRVRRYEWWNRPPLRDLDTERELAMAQLAVLLQAEDAVEKSRRAKRSKRRTKRTS